MACETPWEPSEVWLPYTRTTQDFTGECINLLPIDNGNTGIPFSQLPDDVISQFKTTNGDFTQLFEANSNFAELLEKPSNSEFNACIQNYQIEDAIFELLSSTYSQLYDEILENPDTDQNFHSVYGNLPGHLNIRVNCKMSYHDIGNDCYDINLQIVLTHNERNHYILMDTTIHYSANPDNL